MTLVNMKLFFFVGIPKGLKKLISKVQDFGNFELSPMLLIYFPISGADIKHVQSLMINVASLFRTRSNEVLPSTG